MAIPSRHPAPALRTLQPNLPGLVLPTLRGRPGHPTWIKRVCEYLVTTLQFTATECHQVLPMVRPWTIHHWSSAHGWRKVARTASGPDLSRRTAPTLRGPRVPRETPAPQEWMA